MIRIFFVFSAVLFMFCTSSCVHTVEKKSKIPPKKLLSKEEMVNLLVDLHLAEAQAGFYGNRGVKLDSLAIEIHAYVFEKYGINKENIDSNISFYGDSPQELYQMYELALEGLSRQQALLTKE